MAGEDPSTNGERRADSESRRRLEEIAKTYDAFAHRVTWLLRIGIVLIFAQAVVATYLINQNSDRTTQIQDSRVQQCLDTNVRHRVAVKKLDMLISLAPPGAQRQHAERSRTATIELITALAPLRHCHKL
jgi:hypothetical protein